LEGFEAVVAERISGVRLGLLSHVAYRRLFIGQAASLLGDRIAPIALAFGVLGIRGRASDLGFVLSAQTFSLLAFVLIGGVWADRVSRRAVMIASDLIRMGVQVGAGALLISHTARIWELVLLATGYGAAQAFFTPALVGLIPSIVPSERLRDANALRGLANSAAVVAGPAIAGLLIATSGPGLGLILDGASFAVSAVALVGIRVPHSPVEARSPFLHDIRQGFSAVMQRPWLATTIGYWGLYNITAWPAFFVLGPLISRTEWSGAGTWSSILVVGGAGALAGGAVALRVKLRRELAVCVALTALSWPVELLLAIPATPALVAASVLCLFFASAWANALWTTTLQRHIPPDELSRVSSIDYLGTYAISPIGYLLIGGLVHSIGVQSALLISCAVGASATLCALSSSAVRHLSVEASSPAEGNLALSEGGDHVLPEEL
jgi:MFS family permease